MDTGVMRADRDFDKKGTAERSDVRSRTYLRKKKDEYFERGIIILIGKHFHAQLPV